MRKGWSPEREKRCEEGRKALSQGAAGRKAPGHVWR